MSPVARIAVSAAFAVVLAGGLVSCRSAPAPGPTVTRATGSSDGRVAVELSQGRSDVASGTLVLRVGNATASDIRIESVEVITAAFSTPVEWSKGTRIPGGAQRDIRFSAPPFACPLADSAAAAVVTYTIGGDERHAVHLDAPDPLGVIERSAGAECVAAAVDEIADVFLADEPRIEVRDGVPVALVDLVAEPTGGSGRLTLSTVSPTTLLAPSDGAASWSAGLEVSSSSGRRTAALAVVPARCDAHAVAEDKVGTIFEIAVSVDGVDGPDGADGVDGILEVPASDELRTALYAFVTESCGSG